MSLTLQHLEQEESYQRAYLERILGVTWDRDTLKSMLAGGKGGATANSMFIPLSLILRPDLLKELTTFANAVKNPSGIDTSNTEELFDASKEVFLSLLRGAPPVTE